MEEKSSARFSEYLFAKMDGQDVSASQGPRKVTADTRKWMRDNLLLLVTLSGVLLGVILGECGLRSFPNPRHGSLLPKQTNTFTQVLFTCPPPTYRARARARQDGHGKKDYVERVGIPLECRKRRKDEGRKTLVLSRYQRKAT